MLLKRCATVTLTFVGSLLSILLGGGPASAHPTHTRPFVSVVLSSSSINLGSALLFEIGIHNPLDEVVGSVDLTNSLGGSACTDASISDGSNGNPGYLCFYTPQAVGSFSKVFTIKYSLGNVPKSVSRRVTYTVLRARNSLTAKVLQAGQTVTAVPLGTSVTDQATVSGAVAGTPTGTVTFIFFSNGTCTGAGTEGSPETLTLGVANSASEGPLLAGSYSFQATYSGDANYLGSTGGCEPLTVNKASSATVTSMKQAGQTVTSVAIGSSVTDQATVAGTGAGTPTGTVTFTFFSNGTCTGTGTAGSPETVASGVANSASEGPLNAGSYSFQATYGGDANYLGSTTVCESLTVSDLSSSTVTTVQQGGSAVTSVAIGSSVTDQATVSGTGAGTPTGTVTFTFFSNATCTGTGSPAGTATLTAGVANSNSEELFAAGSYSFQATYSGNGNYPSSAGGCEPFSVGAGSDMTATTVRQGGSAVTSVAIGSSVTDQATVSGTGAGTPTGTVTFTFFSNATCSGTGSPAGTGTLSAGVANSSSEGPLTAGSYSFQATYNGDTNYLTSTGACEPFTVTEATSQTATTVRQGGSAVTSVAIGSSVTDQATVSGTGAGTPTGTVTFTFFSNATCSGTGSPAGTGTLSAGVANSSSEGPLTAGSYSFQATYNGDTNYLTSTGACEPVTAGAGSAEVVTTVQQGGTNTTSVPAGASVTDQATVSGSGAGTPTGTVTFTSFANGTCAGTGTPAGTGILASGVANSNTVGPLTVGGSYSFQATYNGDANYVSHTGPCEPFTVTAPVLTITKTADAGSVPAGNAIGFTVVVSNGSPGTATSVTVNDPLPAGSGISWSITPAYSGPGTCSITGSPPSQVLTCALGDMASGGSASVHIQSATTTASPGTYKNTATASATNAPSVSAMATVTVTVPVVPHTSLTETASVTIENNDVPVTFTYSETNIGTVGITGVAVTGSLCGPATFVSSSNGDTAVLDPGATWIYTCTVTLTNNTDMAVVETDMATATGTSVVSGLPASQETASASVTLLATPQTNSTPTSGSITLGTKDSDTVVLTGYGDVNPTGTVTFFVTTKKGVHEVGVVQVSASGGDAAVATSPEYKPTATGTYCFMVLYSGDADYFSALDSDSSGCFTVVQGQTSVASPSQQAGLTRSDDPGSAAEPCRDCSRAQEPAGLTVWAVTYVRRGGGGQRLPRYLKASTRPPKHAASMA